MLIFYRQDGGQNYKISMASRILGKCDEVGKKKPSYQHDMLEATKSRLNQENACYHLVLLSES